MAEMYRPPEAAIVLPGTDCAVADCRLPECTDSAVSLTGWGLRRIVVFDHHLNSPDLDVVEPAAANQSLSKADTIN
jgi:hypothetical protein